MFGSTSNRPVNVLNAISGQHEVVATARNEGPATTVPFRWQGGEGRLPDL